MSKVSVELSATSDSFTVATQQAVESLDKLNSAAKHDLAIHASGEQALGVLARIKEKLEALKQQGGRRSAIGELAETFRGGGAVGGVTALERFSITPLRR